MRDKLIELIKGVCDTELSELCLECFADDVCLADGYCGYCDKWLDGVADHLLANGVTVQQWIPVSERLPNVDTKDYPWESVCVIVHIKGDTESRCRVYARDRVRGKSVYRWKYPWGYISYEEITAWMPLPEPPKEGE